MDSTTKEDSTSRLKVSGVLSVDTVADFQRLGFDALAAAETELVVDLGEAEIFGSATLALLISWQRESIRAGKTLRIENPPSHLLEMARISGVAEILPFQKI